jgi:hypothetical protein
MKRILLIAILTISVFIQACATATGHWEVGSYRTSSVVGPGGYVKNYQLGVEKSAFIGQEIIWVKKYGETVLSALALETAIITTRYNGRDYELKLKKDEEKTLLETINFGDKYYLLGFKDFHLLISEDGGVYKKSLYSSQFKSMYTPNKGVSIEPQNFKLLLKYKYSVPLLSYQLIYTGINDVSINTTYREYTGDDLARPAFFQSITYNAGAKQIRFRDFLVQIHDVTNEKITYTILEDGLR